MTNIIEFEKIRRKRFSSKTTLKDLGIEECSLNTSRLYEELDERYKNSRGSEPIDKYVVCNDGRELLDKLVEVLDGFEEEHTAWIVLSKHEDYTYIRERRKVLISKKGEIGKKLKEIVNVYALDYIIILEETRFGEYSLISSE